MENKNNIIIEGITGSGKKSVIKVLESKNITNVSLGNLLKPLLTIHPNFFPKNITQDIIIILECDHLIASQRSGESRIDLIFFEKVRYRQLSAYYGNMHIIDTTNIDVNEVSNAIESIISGSFTYFIPCIRNFSEQDFEKLPFIVEGESKIVREYNSRFHIVKYKPTVYSHKKQRAGEVENTDIERIKMTRAILDILSRHQIKHCYWFVGDNYILTESLDNKKDIPPLEVIVKRCFIGSDKHRYFKLEELNNRFGQPVVNNKNEYQKLLVRFDYRNPNFHPETGEPIGDILVCDDLADEFINTRVAKTTALKIFNALDYHFMKNKIYFQDVCFMLTVDGDKLYGEISQDCGRYKNISDNELSDLDKDIWRAGGSSELVLQKYRYIRELLENYVKEVLYFDNNLKLY